MGSRSFSHDPYGYAVLGEPTSPHTLGELFTLKTICGHRRDKLSPYPVSEASSSQVTSGVTTPNESPHHGPAPTPPAPAPIADDAYPPLDQVTLLDSVSFDEAEDEETVCLFVGQLPFRINDNKVAWLVRNIGGASKIFAIEAIWKRNPSTGLMQHKGCAQVSVLASEAKDIIAKLHHQVIVDYHSVLLGSLENVAQYCRYHPKSRPMVCQESNRQVPLR